MDVIGAEALPLAEELFKTATAISCLVMQDVPDFLQHPDVTSEHMRGQSPAAIAERVAHNQAVLHDLQSRAVRLCVAVSDTTCPLIGPLAWTEQMGFFKELADNRLAKVLVTPNNSRSFSSCTQITTDNRQHSLLVDWQGSPAILSQDHLFFERYAGIIKIAQKTAYRDSQARLATLAVAGH